MKRIAKSNEGLTLVELLVSVAVLSILMAGAFALMRQAAQYHSQSAREVEIQNQLQTAFTQVSDIMVDAHIGIEFDAARGRLIACHNDQFYVLEKRGANLYINLKEYADSSDTVDAKLQEARTHIMVVNDRNLLSDRVATFLVDTSGQADGYVVLAMRCTYNNRSAYLSQNVFLRNSDTGSNILSGGTQTATLTAQSCSDNTTCYYVDISSLAGKNIISMQLTGANTTAETTASLHQLNSGVDIELVTASNYASQSSSLGISLTTNTAATVFSSPVTLSETYLIISMPSTANSPNQLIVTYRNADE